MIDFNEDEGYIEQNRTDISLSVLGIVLITFALITVFYKFAPDYIQERLERETKSIGKKQKIVQEINDDLEGLVKKGLSFERLEAYIDKSLSELEQSRKELEKKQTTLSKQKQNLSLLREIGFLKNQKKQITQNYQSKVKLINEMKGKVVTIKGTGKRSGWQRDTSGRLHFVYTSSGDGVSFDGVPIRESEFEGIISWATKDGIPIVARIEKGEKPYWVESVFDNHGWGPATMELK